MRYLAILSVEDAIAVDCAGSRIHERGKGEVELLAHCRQVFRGVGADHPDCGTLLIEALNVSLQLTELRSAVRSPGATEEYEHEVALVAEIFETV